MVRRQDEGVSEAVERQRDEDPALNNYITGLEEALERHRRAVANQRKATAALMSEQNRTIQKQLDLQANETRLARRAQLVSILYDPVQGCDATAEPQRCPPSASRKARGEAVRVLTEIAREARQAAKASGVLSVERDADLSGVDLRQVDLVRVNFRGVNLAEAQLKGAYLTEALLSGVRLEGADLTNARLSGATFDRLTTWPAGFDPVRAGAHLIK